MNKSLKSDLNERGFCVFEKAFHPEELDSIRQTSRQALKLLPVSHREKNKSQGSLILIANYPEFSRLIAHQVLLNIFKKLGFSDTRFSSGYIISKPERGPALFWHQDWWGWGNSISYKDQIPQIFVMIYLQDTSTKNGCLRVIPGSHRTPHSLHDSNNAHSESISRVENPEDPLYQSVDGEHAVPVQYGDVLVGDARLIHGTFPNVADDERTLITLWFHPNYSNLPGPIQVRIHEIFMRKGVDTDPDGLDSMTLLNWPEEEKKIVEPMFPAHPPNVTAEVWDRNPHW
ncbi:MAG: phytanoyl-CoA dioxygenase family protein [SAR324 cluster bacterium]|jgi:hypothetical protein|nr:phytanoyl-CoA dioxygenase [Deltaproteobacteria bacterium]MDP6247575.1 phytanoyl-CoA dioxygenase family protein [SAR324 cluster bacterium]MBP45264.1 phytanoyl-CoA dioxygenase [Deltaproteobacteria bacterium]MDP6639136.1 phytanoyl-CoA dioxygenase family protein [SAR324 cluster bacterium]MDP7136923.1 phytanoyl-CoA dioxygenase family protein [SAR324 cluster bacterium]|tara:strand:- start:1580 stop:2440 length:861 start_codon:yes stop_codon:yes gene_type:complete